MKQKPLPATGHPTLAKTPPRVSILQALRTTAPPKPMAHPSPPASATPAVCLAADIAGRAYTPAPYTTGNALLDGLLVSVRSCTRDRYMKEPEVLSIVGRSKAAMRKDVSLGLFVAPVKIGVKSSGWRESEVLGWVEATTILSRVANPGFDMKEFVAALMASRIPL